MKIPALKSFRHIFCALPLVIVIMLSCSRAVAQRGSEFNRAAAKLPASARTVVTKLLSLRELPDGVWKMHVGDLPHAEDVNLDTSGWTVIAPKSKAPTDAVWFRQTVEVPQTLEGYDLTGARIWFQFHADANGPMPQILYFNGRRVALGDDLEPIVLFDKAQPGEKVVIAVKLLHTVDVKTFHGATLRIDFPENRPNPVDLAEEFLGAAEMVPSLAPGDTAKTDILHKAVATVDMAALSAHNQAKFDASLKAAQQKLDALRPLLQQATFHLDGNAHIDAAWLWPWTETVDAVKRTFSTALQLMEEYPDYTFTQSAAAYNEWMADKYPDINAQIAERIKEGRWEIVGGMWVEPDLNMPGGESLVRQILVGKRWYEKAYGVDVKVGWNPDSFGYTWQLPQIYKKSGIDYFVTQKMSWNDTNKLPFKLFWWESPDGSKILTYFPHDYVNTTLNPVRLSDDMALARRESPGMNQMLDLYGVGDHGGGPTRAMLDEGFHWAAPGHVTPKYQFGTALSYFHTVEQEIAPRSKTWNYQSIARGYEPPAPVAGKIAIPTWDSELYLEYHRGVFTTQAAHKHGMRFSEEEVLNAEKWAALAWLDGRSYPGNDLTEDWKKVLFNQFHDLAAGSGIGIIYKDAQKDFEWVKMSTDEIRSGALHTLAEHVDTAGQGVPVLVYNPLGWTRSGDVHVQVQLPEAGARGVLVVDPSAHDAGSLPEQERVDAKTGIANLVIHVAHVPALGYKLVHIVPSANAGVDKVAAVDSADSVALGEGALQVAVNKQTGCITSLKVDGFETLAAGACGNELQAFHDLPKQYDAWNIDPGTLDQPPAKLDKADSVELMKTPGHAPAIRIVRTWQKSKFVQTITLPRGTEQVDVDNDIDWHESHVLLKAAFPLAVENNFATYEIPYGTIERPTTRNNSWEKAQFEVPALRWADLSGKAADGKVYGLSVLNQDKYGYDAVGNMLRLTLLRSPKWPDPDADMGHQHFHYALYPHAGTWKDALTVRRGWEYNYPLQAVATTAHAGSMPAEHSFASVSPDDVVLTAMKKAEDAHSLIFRAYEWAGKDATAEFHVPAGATGATVTNLMEKPEGSPLPVTDGVVRVPIHPYEILTIRVDYPEGTRD